MTGLPLYLDANVAPSNDIALLRQHINTVPFDYVDVATQVAHDSALRRWPLLAELQGVRNAGPLTTKPVCKVLTQPACDKEALCK